MPRFCIIPWNFGQIATKPWFKCGTIISSTGLSPLLKIDPPLVRSGFCFPSQEKGERNMICDFAIQVLLFFCNFFGIHWESKLHKTSCVLSLSKNYSLALETDPLGIIWVVERFASSSHWRLTTVDLIMDIKGNFLWLPSDNRTHNNRSCRVFFVPG